jgi:ribonuclease PH
MEQIQIPMEKLEDLNKFSEKWKVVCDVKLAPFANRGERRGRSGRSVNEQEFSALLEQALIASVCLEKYPKSVLNVYGRR